MSNRYTMTLNYTSSLSNFKVERVHTRCFEAANMDEATLLFAGIKKSFLHTTRTWNEKRMTGFSLQENR